MQLIITKSYFIGTFHLSTSSVTYIPKQFHEVMNQNRDGMLRSFLSKYLGNYKSSPTKLYFTINQHSDFKYLSVDNPSHKLLSCLDYVAVRST